MSALHISISLAEKIVSLMDLSADGTPMTVAESSMNIDDAEIIFNDAELIVVELGIIRRHLQSRFMDVT